MIKRDYFYSTGDYRTVVWFVDHERRAHNCGYSLPIVEDRRTWGGLKDGLTSRVR